MPILVGPTWPVRNTCVAVLGAITLGTQCRGGWTCAMVAILRTPYLIKCRNRIEAPKPAGCASAIGTTFTTFMTCSSAESPTTSP